LTVPTGDGTPILLACFDKFRGTISAREACEAAADAARRAGIEALICPLADGGEGTLDAVGGAAMFTTVTGPDRTQIRAEWRLVEAVDGPATGVIEMARAAGLDLVGGAGGNDPLTATTRGVGELVLAAIGAGCDRVIVGCGGSATTDGGAGLLEVVTAHDLEGVELFGACDVGTTFVDAARVFGPQKGADEAGVIELTSRLVTLAERYLEQFGVDVRSLPRSGAAGGLGGALAVLGGTLVSGFDLLAGLVGFPVALSSADIVVTGEGRLDATSLDGKVVGGVVALAHGRAPVLVIAGDAEDGILEGRDGCTVISLTARFGRAAALETAAGLVARVVREELRATGWP
jgi:glycerate kinase